MNDTTATPTTATAPANAATTTAQQPTPAAATPGTVPITSRAEARAAIRRESEKAAGIGSSAEPATSTATSTAATASDRSAPNAAPAAASPAATSPAAAETPTVPDALEIHPESGPSTELGSLTLRFKGDGGKYVAVPEGLATQMIELEVGGKTYVKDFAGISRLAADGIANQRHATENRRLTTQVIPQYEQHVGSLQDQLNDMIALNREILGDEGKYAARRQEFMELNSPEQRADRAERALVEREQRDADSRQSQEHVAYYKANVLPALVSVLNDSPTLSNEEVMGRIQLETGHLLRDGVVPPENYPAFANYLRTSLAPWAKGLHEQRSQADTARREAEERAARERDEAARRQRQLDTQSVGAMVPAANALNGPLTTTSRELPPPKSRAEARQRIQDAVRASAAASG